MERPQSAPRRYGEYGKYGKIEHSRADRRNQINQWKQLAAEEYGSQSNQEDYSGGYMPEYLEDFSNVNELENQIRIDRDNQRGDRFRELDDMMLREPTNHINQYEGGDIE